MTFDDIIVTTGGFGRYQRRVYTLICLAVLPFSFQVMAGVFLAAKTDFRCLESHENPENATFQLPLNLANGSYHSHDGTEYRGSQCKRLDVNITDPINDSDGYISSTSPTVKCGSFVYDKSTYALTIVTEFDLVCDRAWLRTVAESSFTVGVMLGRTMFGILADIYGRKPIFRSCIIIQAIIGLLIAAAPEIISYTIFRLIMGSAVSGVSSVNYVIAFEMVVPDRRLMVGMGIELSFSLGYILLVGLAYFLTNWRYLQILVSLPYIAILLYWWFIPESTRWLVTTGRLKEAKDAIQKISLNNGVKLSPDTLDNMLSDCHVVEPDSARTFQFSDLLKYPNLRRKTLLLCFISFVNSSTYYGLSWNTSSLAGNNYINFAISGLVEIPGTLFVFFTLDRWGRRYILCTSMLIAGTSLLLRIFVPDHISWLEVALIMMGKLAITSSLTALGVFATEQFPTVIRNVGGGIAASCGVMGTILSSYINFSAVVWTHLPVLIFGSGALMAGLLTLLLPETLNQKLPETIEDGEQFGKKSKLDVKSSTGIVFSSSYRRWNDMYE